MNKYIGTYSDGTKIAVWSIDMKMAKFHLKDNERLYGKIIKIEKVKKVA